MTVGYVNPPSVSDYSKLGGGAPIFKFDVYKGRTKYRGGKIKKRRHFGFKTKRYGRYANYAQFNTVRGRNVLKLLASWGPKILSIFKSPALRKVASKIGTAGAAAAINTGIEKLTTRKKTPFRKLAKKHGSKAAAEVLQGVKEEMGGTGRRRRRGRRGRRGTRKSKRRVGRPRKRQVALGGRRRKRIKRVGRRRRRQRRDIFS